MSKNSCRTLLYILYDRRGGFLGGAFEWFQRSYIIVMPCLWSIRRSYSAIWSFSLTNYILTLDQLQWLPNLSDSPPISLPWYRAWPSPNYEWFLWSICNGCGMPVGNPSGHLVPSHFWGLAYDLIVETSFPEFVLSFLDFLPWIPLRTSSILPFIIIIIIYQCIGQLL